MGRLCLSPTPLREHPGGVPGFTRGGPGGVPGGPRGVSGGSWGVTDLLGEKKSAATAAGLFNMTQYELEIRRGVSLMA